MYRTNYLNSGNFTLIVKLGYSETDIGEIRTGSDTGLLLYLG